MYRNETRRAVLPNQVTSIDTLRALFVCVFPHALSMPLLQSASRKIYILDKLSGVFYELDDLMYDHSCSFKPIIYLFSLFNPLMGTGATSNNMKLVHWPLIGGLLRWAVTFGTARSELGGATAHPDPFMFYQFNSPPINGQCTNNRCCAV